MYMYKNSIYMYTLTICTCHKVSEGCKFDIFAAAVLEPRHIVLFKAHARNGLSTLPPEVCYIPTSPSGVLT